MLISRGTIRVGDALVAGEASGRVRAMRDFKGAPLEERRPVDAGRDHRLRRPSRGGRVLSRRQGRPHGSLARRSERANRLKTEALASQHALTLDDVFARIAAGKVLGPQSRRQGRRAGQHRGAQRRSAQDPAPRGQGAHHPLGRRAASTRATSCSRARPTAIIIGFNVRPEPGGHGRWPRARASTCAPTGHLQGDRRHHRGAGRHAQADLPRSSSARPRCARPSRLRSSARSPAAW